MWGAPEWEDTDTGRGNRLNSLLPETEDQAIAPPRKVGVGPKSKVFDYIHHTA
jgi:hypothetical protein